MREDQVHLGANQLGGQFRKSLVVPLRPAVLDGDVRTLDITEVAQTHADSLKPRGKRRWRCHAEESDPRHLARLLRAHRERPRGRAAEQRDELPPFHSITSSARASSVRGTSMFNARAAAWLIASSNLTGVCTGRSAGLARPLRMRSTYPAALRNVSARSNP